MSTTFSAEDVAAGLERWLKVRRDEYPEGVLHWLTFNGLLDEAREAAAVGALPWQRLSDTVDACGDSLCGGDSGPRPTCGRDIAALAPGDA